MIEKNVKSCTFRNNDELHRFELKCKKSLAYVNYIADDNRIILVTSHIPPVFHEIKGFGEELLRRIKKEVKSRAMELDSICPYFNALMKKG